MAAFISSTFTLNRDRRYSYSLGARFALQNAGIRITGPNAGLYRRWGWLYLADDDNFGSGSFETLVLLGAVWETAQKFRPVTGSQNASRLVFRADSKIPTVGSLQFFGFVP